MLLSAANTIAREPLITPTLKTPAASLAETFEAATSISASISAPVIRKPKSPLRETKPAISTAKPTTETLWMLRPAFKSALTPPIAMVSGVVA